MNLNMRSIILIVVALGVAGVTAMLARNLINTPQPAATGDAPAVVLVPESKMKILVAVTNMPVGHFIKVEDMVWQSWPDDTVHERYIQQDAEITPESFAGAVVNSAISAGEPILDNRLVKPGDRGFMAAVLPVGKRAISIRITVTSGNAGFVFPGDRVDILLTHEVKVRSADRLTARVSETVLKDVRVLAINQSTDNLTHTPSIGQTATLEVTTKEAEKIALIRRMGELTLVLRSLGNEKKDPILHANSKKPTFTWDSEVSKQISGTSGSGATGKFSVQVFRGGGVEGDKTDFTNPQDEKTTSERGAPNQ